MSNNKTKRVSVFSILIFVLCGLLCTYAIWSMFSVTSYIKEMLEYGSITVSGNFFDIMSYYMTNCGNYIVYIAILLAIWWIRPRAKAAQVTTEEVIEYDAITDPKTGITEETVIDVKATVTDSENSKDAADLKAEIDENDESAYAPDAVKEFKESMNIPHDPDDDEKK